MARWLRIQGLEQTAFNRGKRRDPWRGSRVAVSDGWSCGLRFKRSRSCCCQNTVNQVVIRYNPRIESGCQPLSNLRNASALGLPALDRRERGESRGLLGKLGESDVSIISMVCRSERKCPKGCVAGRSDDSLPSNPQLGIYIPTFRNWIAGLSCRGGRSVLA
jgi:hypothetical protein